MAFTPRKHCSWNHRFDDPERRYRTLYCAERPLTCLRETLASFRPDAKTVADFQTRFGKLPASVGSVPQGWLEEHALAPGRIDVRQGEIVNADDLSVRRQFQREHAPLLVEHGLEHLDVTELRGRNREVTRTFSRFLFDSGAAGILYRSNLDALHCLALFEGRALLTTDEEPTALTKLPDELLRVCDEFGLTCSTAP